MKFLKIGLIAVFAALFIIACSKTTTTTTTTTNNTNTTAASNSANKPAANADTPAATPADELATARKTFKDECAKCHKEDGKGGESTVDGKKVKAPDFTSEKTKAEYDENDYIDVITNGEGSKMPAFDKKIPEPEIKNLVKLIRKDFQGK